MESIGSRIKNLRQKYNFTSDSVAMLLDVKIDELEKIESDCMVLTVSQLEQLCDIYCVDEEYILDNYVSTHKKLFYMENLDVNTQYNMNKIVRNIDFLVSIF